MPLLRRIAAAFTTALLLQLTLLAGGTLCALQGGAAPDTMAGMAGLHGAHRAGAATNRVSPALWAVSDTPPATHRCDGTEQGDGCRHPWAPGQCVSMTTCTAVGAPAGEIIAQVAVFSSTADLPEPASIASGPTAAPELPPPRA